MDALQANIRSLARSSLRWSLGVLATVVLLTLASCGTPKGQVRIQGNISGLKQADLVLISPTASLDKIDTLHIRGEQFDYTCDLADERALYSIVFPGNASELVLWAHGGETIEIDGNKDDLWHAEVGGNDENELYTEFRKKTNPQDSASLRKEAATIIREHPESAVSTYLLTQYYVLPNNQPVKEVQTLYDLLLKAQPKDPDVVALGGQIKLQNALQAGSRMQDFDLLANDNRHHRLTDYKGKTLVLYFWAGWQNNANSVHHEMARLLEESVMPSEGQHELNVEVLGYNLDIDSTTMSVNQTVESRPIPTVCDFKCFESPFVGELGIRTVPFIIVVGPDGKIQFTTTDAMTIRKRLLGSK